MKNRPLSFKQLLGRSGTPVKPELPKQSQQDIENKIVHDYCNSFKCPLCQCLLDGRGTFNGIVTLRCSWNPDHFSVTFNVSDVYSIFLIQDILVYLDIKSRKKFVIERQFESNAVRITYLKIHDVDGNGDQFEAKLPKVVSLPGNVFNFEKLDEKKLISAIKTALIFS
jgi:hypothetical protein